MFKKIVAILMIAAMSMCLLASCGSKNNASGTPGKTDSNFNQTGLPIVNEKVTYKIMRAGGGDEPTDINDWPFLAELEERTNVHIEWITVPSSGFSEKKNLMFSSGEYPDAILAELSDVDILKNSSAMVPLNDLIDKYAPDIVNAFEKEPELKKVLTMPDGNIYTFGQVRQLADTPQMFSINQTWLDNLGLSMPTTTDELYDVLKAFKTQDPNKNGKNDEIPLTFMPKGNTSGWAPLFGSFGIIDYSSPKTAVSQHVNVEDGKVVYVPTDDRYKEAIEYFNKLYSEGLIDKEAFTQDGTQYSAKIENPAGVVGMFASWCGMDAGANNYSENFTEFLPVKGPEGYQLYTKNNAATYRRNLAAIFTTAKNPEILVRWFNEFYKEDLGIQSYYGPYDLMLNKESDGSLTYILDDKGETVDKWANCFADNTPTAIFPEWDEKIIKDDYNNLKWENNSHLKQYQPAEIYPNVIYTTDQIDQMNVLLTDIDAYVAKMQTKWVVEGGIEDDWEVYLKQLDKLKLPDLVKIYQDALDTYNRN